LDSQLAKTSV